VEKSEVIQADISITRLKYQELYKEGSNSELAKARKKLNDAYKAWIM
jgi:hypothetical protein